MNVTASQPCSNCKEEITKAALTEAEALKVYEWVSKSALCEQCERAQFESYWC